MIGQQLVSARLSCFVFLSVRHRRIGQVGIAEAANFDQSPLDLSAALRAVGALDHADTATRYLGSLRVSEAAQPEREALRQQVAKFSA